MLIKTLQVGMLETNCYIVTDEETMRCAIIDPGAESNTILDYIESNGMKPEAIILTHGHFDHCMALKNVQEATGVPVYVNKKDVDNSGINERFKADRCNGMTYCGEGDMIVVGGLCFRVMETPGHSPGSITLLCSASGDAHDALFTGDTLFCGDCGRTDLEGGNRNTILMSLRRISELPGDYEVYPGHDESTTLDNERLYNLDMKIATGVVD